MLIEASHALAHLDADGLEEMALSCAALVRGADREPSDAKNQCKSGSAEALQGMAIFERVLEATRADLNVVRRLRQLGSAQLEYGPAQAFESAPRQREHGDH